MASKKNVLDSAAPKTMQAQVLEAPKKDPVVGVNPFNRWGFTENNAYESSVTQVQNAIAKNEQDVYNNVVNCGGKTGSLDVEGLKSIGWKQSDIILFKSVGLNWDASANDENKVSDNDKKAFGKLTKETINETYKSTLVYCPMINMDGLKDATEFFNVCTKMVAVPSFDTHTVTNMASMFNGCSVLTTVPMLDATNVTSMNNVFASCTELANFGGFKNLYADLNVSANTKLSKASLINIINNLKDNTMSEAPTKTLTLSSTQKQSIKDFISIAEGKGWTINQSE